MCVNEVEKAKNKLAQARIQAGRQGERGEKVDIDKQLHTSDEKDGQGRGDGTEKHRKTEMRGWVVIGREKNADAEGCLKRVDAGNRLPLTRG